MSFPEYLNSKQNLLIVWLLFHGAILYMNYSGTSDSLGQNNPADFSIYNIPVEKKVDKKQAAEQEFWPFVNFYSGVTILNVGGMGEVHHSHFNGVLYGYDLTEFMYYFLILIFLLYLRWIYKTYNPKRNPGNREKWLYREA